MNEVKKSFLGAGAVILAAGAVVFGSTVRDRVDLGESGVGRLTADLGRENLLASNEKTTDGVPVDSFFLQMSELLKKHYVEPIKDDTKLATGAVRGMVSSLGDVRSLFMDKDEFRVYLQNLNGVYEGIGVDLVLDLPVELRSGAKTPEVAEGVDPAEQSVASGMRIPKLMVASVVPGGPADRAGVKPGDWVEKINGHFVVNPLLVQDFRRIQLLAQKPDIQVRELNELRQELTQKMEGSLMPLRAKDKLVIGTAGSLKIGWRRGDGPRETEIVKAKTTDPLFTSTGDTARLRIAKGAVEPLEEFLKTRRAVTLDLRQNSVGDGAALRSVLSALAPAGKYGVFANERNKQGPALTVKEGNARPPKITLLVDRSTRGPAEVLALALSSRGLATLSGGKTGGARENLEVVALPDGSGYTLVTGIYQAKSAAEVKTR